jgi:aquaporin related protein
MNIDQDKIKQWLVLFFAELIASAILLFIGCLGCVDQFEHFHPTHLTICLGFGFAIMISINTFGCVSGGHMSPAVTLAAVVYRIIDIPVSGLSPSSAYRYHFNNPPQTSIVYVIGQIVGSLLGYWLVRLLAVDAMLSNPDSFCLAQPGLDNARSFVAEFLITFILVIVFCGVIDPRNKNHHGESLFRLFMHTQKEFLVE